MNYQNELYLALLMLFFLYFAEVFYHKPQDGRELTAAAKLPGM
jgi:hypothetical protein